ncbi:histidine kinase [Blautia liquoris]|uniref:Histidine kinase n=1 Tax=Blautia liquoris TaxID=2779518 RepID=A0A7M2REB2_9FIRM|nr:histidine kinase [Blautia liquoris]QOV18673.1 histidine kinase [Blautia liquoris]
MKKDYKESKIFMWIIIVLFIGFAVIISSYFSKREDIIQSEVNRMENSSDSVEASLNNSLGCMETLNQIHYFDFTARKILLTDQVMDDKKTKFEETMYMDNALKHIVGLYSVVAQAAIITEKGNVYSNQASVFEKYLDFVQEEKSANIRNGFTGTYYTQPYERCSNLAAGKVFTAIHPIYAYLNSELAVICVDIDYNALEKVVKDSIKGQDGCYILFYGDRPVIKIDEGESPESTARNPVSELSRKVMNKKYPYGTTKTMINGEKGYVIKKYNMITGLTIVQFESERQMLSTLNKSNQVNVFLMIGVLITILVFFLWTNVMVTRPLTYFERKISNYTSPESLQIVNYEGMRTSKSVHSVMISYNNLVRQINNYIEKEIIYEKNQRTTQAIALRYQINPHFLFNTLNVIGSIAELENVPDVVEVTQNLSMIMRYNVRGTKFVKLKDEINIVDAYIKIQKVRFRDNIEVQYDVPESLMNERIIKFILQPLLENVFKHAYSKGGKEQIHVRISAKRRDQYLIINLQDDGKGIENNQLTEINHILQNETDSQTVLDEEEWSKSIGLKNVNARIKNYYGNECFIRVRSVVSSGTNVEIRLKCLGFEEGKVIR